MHTTTPLAEDRFRALARSSPWRWSTLRFTGRIGAAEPEVHDVRAWLRRPDHLRRERLDGSGWSVVRRDPPAVTARTRPSRTHWAQRRLPFAGDLDVPRDGEGFVVERPSTRYADPDAPVLDYLWIAMLDPVELADPAGPRPGTQLRELVVIDHHGRETWEAIAAPTGDYVPRCPCCSLLVYEASLLGNVPSGWVFPVHHRVRLDVATGVCVASVQLDGPRAGWGLDLAIEEVDGPMPNALFVPPPRRRWWRRRR